MKYQHCMGCRTTEVDAGTNKQTKKGLLGCVCHPFFSSIPRACTHRHTGSAQTCINLHTQGAFPSTPRARHFYILAFLVDCRCSAINSPLIESKKQQQEEKALIPEKQLKDPVDQAVFPKPQQRETPDITQDLSNSKRYLLN